MTLLVCLLYAAYRYNCLTGGLLIALKFEGAEMQLHLSMTLGVYLAWPTWLHTIYTGSAWTNHVYIRISKIFHRATFTEFDDLLILLHSVLFSSVLI